MKKIKIETIRIKTKKFYINKTSKIRKKAIKNDEFTIIANNCWAGFVYQSYGFKYNTPTIGMFFIAEDYIKFISNLKYYLSIEKIDFINPSDSKWYEDLKSKDNFGTYPIGKIEDIEIHFLHYKTKEDAQEKWNKRKQRINYNSILYKFSEMNLCTEKDIKDFQNLNLKNKICFISNKYKNLVDENTYIVSNGKKQQVMASEEPIGKSKIVNINNIINRL